MRSMYDLMVASNTRDEVTQELYPDVLTAPLEKFKFVSPPKEYGLTQQDLLRIDLLMVKAYRTPEYDDIVLCINNVDCIYDTEQYLGTDILIPTKENVDRFYKNNFQ